MRKVDGMKREREISRDEQSHIGLRKLVGIFLADSLLIYFTNILSKNRNGSMTSASSPRDEH